MQPPPVAGSIVGRDARIVDPSGAEIPQAQLIRPLTLPRGYGYPTTPADNWTMIWMAMNHRHQRREAYVEYRVTVDPAELTPVTP